ITNLISPHDILVSLKYVYYPKIIGWNARRVVREVYTTRTTHIRMEAMPEPLLTLEQVAEYLNVDKFTVYRLLADKELPAFKVGNQWRFKRKMIENWLKKNSNVGRKRSQ